MSGTANFLIVKAGPQDAERVRGGGAADGLADRREIASIGALEGAGWNAGGVAMTNCARAGGRQCQVVVSACSSG